LICVRECKSAIKRKDSFSGSFAIAIAGRTAPNRLPKWGVPVLCTPVRILAIPNLFEQRYFFQLKKRMGMASKKTLLELVIHMLTQIIDYSSKIQINWSLFLLE
jgi:hypothetical protein